MIKVYGQVTHLPEGGETPDYLVEIPDLELMTQAESLDDVIPMVTDMLNLVFEDTGMDDCVIEWDDKAAGRFSVGTEKVDALLAFIMKRKRKEAGITLVQLAERLGFSSHNAIAAYEQATRSPTVEKLAEIAEGLGYELVISWKKKII